MLLQPARDSTLPLILRLFLMGTIVYTTEINRTLPGSITAGYTVTRINMHFYESTMPLIYEMPVPDLSKLQHYTKIPSNSKDPNIVTLNTVLNQIHALLAHTTPIRQPHKVERKKRSLVDMSDFYSWCCGIAKQREVDQLYVHEKSLDSFSNQIKGQMNKDHAFLVKQNKLTNDFQANVERALNTSIYEFSNISNVLVRAEKSMGDAIQSDTVGLIQLASTMYAVLSTTTWNQILSDCRGLLIPMAIISPQLLMKDLLRLNGSLTSQSKTLSIPTNQISTYFTKPIATCLISSSKIIITVKVPIKHSYTTYNLMRIVPLPFSFHNTVCQINIPPSMVLKLNSSFIPLDQSQLMQCDATLSSLCLVSRYSRYAFQSSSCIEAIMTPTESLEQINVVCPLLCTRESTPKTIVQQTRDHEFIIINPVLPVIIKCQAQPDQRITYYSDVGHLGITLPCHCLALIQTHGNHGNITLTPDFPCAADYSHIVFAHHSIPSAFILIDTAEENENNEYMDLTKILNYDWPKTIPHTNLSAPGLEQFSTITPLTRIGTHLSIAHSFIIMAIIAIIIALLFHICRIPIPIFPGVTAVEETEFIMMISAESIQAVILLCLLIVAILTLYVLRNAAILNMQKDRITLSSVKVKAQAKKRKREILDSSPPDEITTRL